jgi:transcriptional regulator with GAF, ATPase, and Fis domain
MASQGVAVGMSVESQAKPLVVALCGALRQLADPIAVLRAILEQAVTLTEVDRGLFVEVLDQGDLAYRVLHGFEPKHVDAQAGFSRGVFQRALETGREVVIENALDDPYFGGIASVQALQARAILCMPIRAGGRHAALVHLESQTPGHFTSQHVELLHALVEIAGPILEALQAGREVIQERDRLRLSESHLRGEAEESRQLLAREWSFGRFVGRSASVRELEVMVAKAAATDYPVVILGETGTGKSIVARVLHYGGPRAGAPLITVFCPMLEKGMVEAELFGHKRGAFTGAVADRPGKVQAAEKGTLFLDEIGELALDIQAKLLRLLQEKSYERIGDAQERRADVRVIAATHRDLENEVQAGRFRRDLYERLHFIPIHVPPLRERREDIPLLLRHCLDQSDQGRWVEISEDASRYLEQLDFSWPGNVRHVEQLAARLVVEQHAGPVPASEVARLLGARERAAPSDGASGAVTLEAGLPRLLEEAEKTWLEEALRRYAGLTRAQVAERLKISESALYKKLRGYGLTD